MTIRPAKFGDIPRMAELLAEMHALSCYADRGTFEVRELKGFLMTSIQRHGGSNPGATLVLVAEKAGAVEGFLIGLLDRAYHLMKELYATDIFFWLSARADPRDAIRLIETFMKWAEQNPRVIEVRLGITDAIGDFERIAVLYRRLGLQQTGVMYGKRFDRAA